MKAWLLVAAGAVAVGCGAPALQKKDEAQVAYRAAFESEAGVSAKVIFPFAADAAQAEIFAGLLVPDGATAELDSSTPEGLGLAVTGRGKVEVSFSAPKVKGYEGEGGVPQAMLSRLAAGGADDVRVLRVNKGGSAQVQVSFEYTASRQCGAGCGGSRSWKFEGPVGLGPQQVNLTYLEEKTP